MLAEITLTALRRTERALGPGAVVTLVRAGLDTADAPLRRTLLLAGMGAALRGGDESAFGWLAARWSSAGDEDDPRGLSLIARLAGDGRYGSALRLARAEHERHASASSAFALAALLEHDARFDEAAARLRDATARGATTDLGERASRAALALAAPEHADEAEKALARSTDARDVLRLAPAALSCARLYARVRTLDRLLELAGADATRAAALRVTLAFADRRGASLGDLERDRVIAIAERARAPKAVLDALAGRAAATDEAAARDALMGHTPGTTSDRAADVALRALSAVVADEGSAPLLLSALAAHPPSPAGWTAVLTALSRPKSRAAAGSVAARWLPLGIAPPRGFSVLATALERAELEAVAERAWSEAIRACEPGARQRVAAALEQRAHAAYAAGDRTLAKALIERSLAIDPD